MPKSLAVPKSSANRLPTITASTRGAARLKSGHPWVYRSDITASPDYLKKLDPATAKARYDGKVNSAQPIPEKQS